MLIYLQQLYRTTKDADESMFVELNVYDLNCNIFSSIVK
jgi:hypothetical protein